MRALLFEGVPSLQEFDGAAATSISGTSVYWQEVVKALFRHGTYDAYFFLWRAPFIQVPEKQASALERVDPRARIINVCGLERLDAYEDVVLFTPAPYVHGLIPLRSSPRSARWIASGVVHSLDGWDMPHLLLSLMHSDVDDADSLLCSTHSARAVLEKLFAATFGRGAGSVEPPRPALPVIPLGIDCEAFLRGSRDEARRGLGIPGDAVVIVYVGRLSPISKCDLLPLCHVIARMAHTRPDIRLVIAGDDTQHRMAGLLESAAETLGCGGRVTALPGISDAEKINLLAAADIFVAPSDHTQETFGLTVAEAMAAALPVLASDWDGYRELVEHGVTGFLTPTYWLPLGEALDRTASTSFLLRNSTLAASTVVDLEALEYYLRLLIERPELRRAMGEAGRRRAQGRYDWGVVIKGYEALWGEGFLKSRALREGRSSFARCPQHYPYQEVFGHYPSRALSYDEVVEITAAGRWFLAAGDSAELTASPNGVTDIAVVRRLLQTAEERGPAPLTELADRVAEAGRLPRLVATTSIMFSLKYDFLRLQTTGFSRAAPGASPEEDAGRR